MMKNSVKQMVATVLVLLTMSTQANEPIGWIHNVEVTRVIVVSNGGVNVSLSPALTGCQSQSGYGETFASVLPTHPGLDKIYSALLSAHVTKTKVSLYLGDDKCTVGEVILGGKWL